MTRRRSVQFYSASGACTGFLQPGGHQEPSLELQFALQQHLHHSHDNNIKLISWPSGLSRLLEGLNNCLNVRQQQSRLLLASLTSTSASAAQHKLRKLSKEVPQLVSRSFPSWWLQAQQAAAIVYEYYLDKQEAFPRPCPVCGKSTFFSSSNTAGGQQEAVGSGLGGIQWRSRPLVCDQSHRWWHYGCVGIKRLEQVPPSPWFHSSDARSMYLKLEADAERGELPAWELGLDAGRYSVSMMTDSDHRQWVLGGVSQSLARGNMAAVYELLSAALPSNLILGYGNASAEFSGGKYALLLRHKDTSVAVATFDVYGSHAAQLHLLTTAEEERRKGHAKALLHILEYRLASFGVQRLVCQPRASSLPVFTSALGFEVVHPADAVQLHKTIPIAFFDSVLVDKELLM